MCVCVCRILTAEGEDIELQGTNDPMPTLMRLKPGVAYGMSVPQQRHSAVYCWVEDSIALHIPSAIVISSLQDGRQGEAVYSACVQACISTARRGRFRRGGAQIEIIEMKLP